MKIDRRSLPRGGKRKKHPTAPWIPLPGKARLEGPAGSVPRGRCRDSLRAEPRAIGCNGLLSAEDTIPRIPQSRQDIAVIVEALIDRRRKDGHVRMLLLKVLDALRGRQ